MYAVMFLTIFVGIYTSRLVLNILGVQDFGIYSLIAGLVLFFTIINSSMSGSIQRFLSASLGQNDIKGTNEYFNSAIVVHIGIALIVLVLGKTIGEWMLWNKLTIPPERLNAAYWVLQAILVSFMLQIISTPAQAMLVAYERMGSVAIITFLNPLGRMVSILVIGQFAKTQHDKLILFTVGIMLFSVLQICLYYLYSLWKCEAASFHITKDKEKYKELTGFAGWGLIGDLSAALKAHGTGILLNMFFGTVANAAYGVSNQVITNFSNLSYMVTRASNPQIIKLYSGGDKSGAFKLVTQLSKISFLILFVVSIPFLLETNWILKIWLNDVPDYAVAFTQGAIVVALVEVVSIPLITLARATGNIKKYQIVVGGLLLLALPITYLLFKIDLPATSIYAVFGILGVVAFLARLHILKEIAQLPSEQFLKVTIAKILPLLGVVFLISYVATVSLHHSIIMLRVINILVIPSLALLLSYFFILSKTERRRLVELAMKRFKR